MTRTISDLQMLQALPLDLKISMTKARIRQWVNEFGEDGVYVSFSGGKDSTALLHLVREMYPYVPGVFCDTGLEYPEIREFVKTFDNIVWVRPKMNFRKVIEKYGYPFISKEVSECVYGARRYLTAVLAEASSDRQTDRQTDRQPYSYRFDRLCGLGEFARNDRGGYDRKYRKLRGIGEFTSSSSSGKNLQRQGDMASRPDLQNSWGGGAARDFANLTGIRTSGGGVDPKLYKGNRQSTSANAHGDLHAPEQDDNGDYP